jgi:ribonuclease T1
VVCGKNVAAQIASSTSSGVLRRAATALLIALAAGLPTGQALGEQLPTISQEALPASGIETYRNIQRGGPFPFEKDGVTFGNRERILPLQKRGFYREYTVKTPGDRNRGAKRIVCGGAAAAPEVCYYTADHYASFRMIVP